MADDLRAVLGRPFPQAVAALRLRLGDLVPTSTWEDMQRNAHDSAFMLAGAQKTDLLAEVLAAIDRARTEGTGIESFRRDWRAAIERHGWHGWTGEGTEKGEAWRTRVVYQTNVKVAHAAGRLAQLRDGNFPLWVYLHGHAREPRPHHLAWHGLVLPADDPGWQTHYAPNGWGCTCRIRGARNEAAARRLGGDPSKPRPSDWDRIDPRTEAPVGIDKGWDYMPGATTADTIRALTRKAVNWDYSLATAYMRDLPAEHVDAFSRGYRALPSLADDVRRWVEGVFGEWNGAAIDRRVVVHPQRTLGLATADQRSWIERITGHPMTGQLYDFTIDTDAVRHVFRSHGDPSVEATRGQRLVGPEDFGRLGALLNAPDRVTAGDVVPGRGPILRYEKRFGDDVLVAMFELRAGRRRLALVTMWVER